MKKKPMNVPGWCVLPAVPVSIAFAELHVPIEQIALALKVDVEAVKKWLRETGK